jgi:hypothetical protein
MTGRAARHVSFLYPIRYSLGSGVIMILPLLSLPLPELSGVVRKKLQSADPFLRKRDNIFSPSRRTQ